LSQTTGLTLTTDAIPQPVALATDRSGGLLVVSRHGNVYAFKPSDSEAEITVLSPVPAAARPDATAWLPANRWRDSHDWLEASIRREPLHYVSADGSAFIPASESYAALTKPGRRGGTIDVARAYALQPARAGQPFYGADEFGQTTWRFTADAEGTLSAPALVAQEGECGTAVDPDGKLYVCAGQIFVYDASGQPLGTIEVPERPSAVVFGGEDGRTLYITARSSLYAVRVGAP
jgi:sugar lactone lactonase YvrE